MKQFIGIILLNLLIACSDDVVLEEAIVNNEPVVSELSVERAERVKEIFRTIPSPVETVELFYVSGTEYNRKFTNSVKNVRNYTTNGEKALNLGVYGADLSYANVSDQSQESMVYISCIKKMADALNITSAFEEVTIERLDVSMNNRDSLMVVIGDVFWIIDAHLKRNGQDYLSALILTGGWVEGLYLGTRILDREHPDVELMKRIAAQKSSLVSLMDLLTKYDSKEVMSVEEEMKVLQTAYAKVDEEVLDTAIIFEIRDAVNQVRKKITH